MSSSYSFLNRLVCPSVEKPQSHTRLSLSLITSTQEVITWSLCGDSTHHCSLNLHEEISQTSLSLKNWNFWPNYAFVFSNSFKRCCEKRPLYQKNRKWLPKGSDRFRSLGMLYALKPYSLLAFPPEYPTGRLGSADVLNLFYSFSFPNLFPFPKF